MFLGAIPTMKIKITDGIVQGLGHVWVRFEPGGVPVKYLEDKYIRRNTEDELLSKAVQGNL